MYVCTTDVIQGHKIDFAILVYLFSFDLQSH